jgi:hypothetical protein
MDDGIRRKGHQSETIPPRAPFYQAEDRFLRRLQLSAPHRTAGIEHESHVEGRTFGRAAVILPVGLDPSDEVTNGPSARPEEPAVNGSGGGENHIGHLLLCR